MNFGRGKCRVCGEAAVVNLRYANLKLCSEHFIDFFERRVLRSIKRYNLVKRGWKVAVAVSGGKDSLALLNALWRRRNELGIEVVALTINLGIENFDIYLDVVHENYRRLGVPYRIIDLEGEYGFRMSDLRGVRKRPVCSFCGVVKRYVLNKAARSVGAQALATGHNLDDFVGTLLQTYIRGDVKQMVRLGPYLPPSNGFVARIKPLIETPEQDTRTYVELLGLNYVKIKCPYSKGAISFEYKELVNALDSRHPGIKFQMLRAFLDRIQPALAVSVERGELTACSKCGEPSSGAVCQFCRIRELALARRKAATA